MGVPQRKKITKIGNKKFHRQQKGKNYAAAVDQIQDRMRAELKSKAPIPLNPELPAMGQIRCTYCARYFTSEAVLTTHMRSKGHKRQVKRVLDTPYNQADADAAAGMAAPMTYKTMHAS